MTHNNVKAHLLPFSVIQKAAGGDVEAINAVLKHYEGYIARLSLRELYDEYDNSPFRLIRLMLLDKHAPAAS